MRYSRGARLTATVVALAVVVAGCTRKQSTDRAEVEIRGSDPATSAGDVNPATPTVAIDANGIASYEGYQAAVARDGDTVASVAARVGLSGAELGAYNGLAPSHTLRGGDELVLPPRPGGYGATTVAAADGAAGTGSGLGVGTASGIEQTTLDGGQPADAVLGSEAGGDAAWSPDLAAKAIERSSGLNEDGSLAAPPSSAEPIPGEPAPAPALESPELGQYQTPEATAEAVPEPAPAAPEATVPVEAGTTAPETEPALAAPEPAPATAPVDNTQLAATDPARAPEISTGLTLARPVSGPIVIGFNQGAGPNRNDGVDFAAAAGTTVHAAEAGEVALVSQALGGLGTIVLVRHRNDLLTVYGRLGDVNVSKGDIVERGEQIGRVAAPGDGSEARMHFELRRGAESVDPTPYL